MIGNKAELARVLKCSLPTVSELLKRHADFPVLQKGANGKPYQIDLDAAVAYLRNVEAQQAAAGAERDALLRQITLPGMDSPEEKAGLKPSDILTLTRVRQLEREELKEAGFLVQSAAVRKALTTAFTRLRTEMGSAVRQACRDHNIPEPTIRSMEARIAEAQRRFVETTRGALSAGDTADDTAPALL